MCSMVLYVALFVCSICLCSLLHVSSSCFMSVAYLICMLTLFPSNIYAKASVVVQINFLMVNLLLTLYLQCV